MFNFVAYNRFYKRRFLHLYVISSLLVGIISVNVNAKIVKQIILTLTYLLMLKTEHQFNTSV